MKFHDAGLNLRFLPICFCSENSSYQMQQFWEPTSKLSPRKPLEIAFSWLKMSPFNSCWHAFQCQHVIIQVIKVIEVKSSLWLKPMMTALTTITKQMSHYSPTLHQLKWFVSSAGGRHQYFIITQTTVINVINGQTFSWLGGIEN